MKKRLDKWQTLCEKLQNPAYKPALFILLKKRIALNMPKILIIDDEKVIRSTLKEILEYEKYEIFEAEDGVKGLEMLKNEDFDLVLCDIKMPKMDGMEVLSKAAELSKQPQALMGREKNWFLIGSTKKVTEKKHHLLPSTVLQFRQS